MVDVALGLFFLAMIPAWRWLRAQDLHIGLGPLALAGGIIGFLTGIVLSTGPLSVPAFAAYGLVQGAFLSTEAASSLTLMVSKVATFRQFGALPPPSILEGLIVDAAVMAGSFVGKAVVRRTSVRTFQLMLDVLLFGSGVSLLWDALL